MADGDNVFFGSKTKRAEGLVITARSGSQPGMLAKHLPGQMPQAPASIALHSAQPGPPLQQEHSQQNTQRAHGKLEASTAPAQQHPQTKRSRHRQRAATAACANQQKKRGPERCKPQQGRSRRREGTAQDKPEGKGRNKRQGYVVAHSVIAEAPREPARIKGVAHDEIRAGQRLMQAIQPFPEAGQHAGPHKAAQVFFAPHAFHADERQNKTLVDACARVKKRSPYVL